MSQAEEPEVSEGSVAHRFSSSGVERLARWLVHRAARRVPASLAARLEEEWLADLNARPSPASRLRFAIGCCWATRVIAREFAAAVPVTNAGIMGGAASNPFAEWRSRRTATFFLVMGLHVAVFYGLIVVGTTVIRPKPIMPLETHMVDQPRKVPPTTIEVPQPTTEKKAIDLKIPQYVDVETQNQTVDDSLVVPYTPPPPPRVDPPSIRRVIGGPGAGFPDTEDYYPSASKRIGEQGVVQVQVCVRPDGRLSADPTLAQTSGFIRLDDGALRLAKAASGHYRPSTEDGRAVASCYAYRIRFTMKE
jgi:periplasmic protein TonB